MISLGQLERRLGWLSFPGLLRYYALLYALVYLLRLVRPDIGEFLDFDRSKILAGEVWRVVTFLFASSGSFGFGGVGLVLMVFLVMIAFMMSDALEDAWGVFKTTLFLICGILGLVAGNFLFPQADAQLRTFVIWFGVFRFCHLVPESGVPVVFHSAGSGPGAGVDPGGGHGAGGFRRTCGWLRFFC